MNLLKLIGKLALFGVAGVAALTIVGKVRQRAAASPAAQAAAVAAKDDKLSDAGFFLLDRNDAKNPNVVIMSPPNCPSDEAARARALAEALREAGIPSEMRQELNVTFTDPADTERVNKYSANLANPLVIVRGWAKGSPTVQDVIAQYNAGR